MSCETSKFIEKETRDYITSAKGQHSPFLSSWLVYCHTDTERILSELLVEEKMHKDFVVARTHKGCKWKLKKRMGSRGKKRKRNKNVGKDECAARSLELGWTGSKTLEKAKEVKNETLESARVYSHMNYIIFLLLCRLKILQLKDKQPLMSTPGI